MSAVMSFAPAQRVSASRISGKAGSSITSRVLRAQPMVNVKRSIVCTANPPSTTDAASTKSKGITIEEQRTVAKELVKYFNDRAYEQEYIASRVFGWTTNAEVTNSRWVMFGLLVGLMTEYATSVNFPGQVALTITNMGFADIYE
eukprot:CAMPEP_0114231788 /NCGR_PEP_ID=MMETSP0058-20121206/4245_1 /TAXON_ID=36894 /ORGANISM="Pyramimonas parkeae, CCMP726" /LENGTH=144 /DNA_ID=CAMNT_0001343189 /DNA_START=89 /DNA_END=523 /DNA_ORIENTATION=+